jgi:hypothetical protein
MKEWFWGLISAGGLVLACSSESARALACGAGTVERDGFCVVATVDSGSPGITTGSTPEAGADECIVPITFYKDNDGDGVGGKETTSACKSPGPGWVTVSGDCDDSDARVRPGAIEFYTTPTKTGSFDYDCDGIEMPNPAAVLGDPKCVGAYPNCPSGEGYLTASEPRDGGGGANYYCGSTRYVLCGVGGNPTRCTGYGSQKPPVACR